MLDAFEASQIDEARTLPADAAQWLATALREDVAFDKEVRSACDELIDVDRALALVEALAKQGDGASLWLMSRSSSNMTDGQQYLRSAAAAGFPQAQFELAWAIIGGQAGAKGSDADAPSAGDLLRSSSESLARSEAELAVCEYSGCDGVDVNLANSVAHAREAAERGVPDAITTIGPHIPVSLVDPDEVSAWGLVSASIELQGCAGHGFSVRWMKGILQTLDSPRISPEARALAEQYWQSYGEQIQSNLGCGT